MKRIALTTTVRTLLLGARAARDYAQADGCAYCRVVKGREAVRNYLISMGASILGTALSHEFVSGVCQLTGLDSLDGEGWFLDLSTGSVVRGS